MGDDTLAASFWSQRTEVQVCQEVGEFSKLVKRSVIISRGLELGFTHQPNCNAAPQESDVFIDRALNVR
jgi:hypothetical protein